MFRSGAGQRDETPQFLSLRHEGPARAIELPRGNPGLTRYRRSSSSKKDDTVPVPLARSTRRVRLSVLPFTVIETR